ncbi:CHASE domain-containing protein [Novosphingobium flavum]|uniref:histidine kinase n=2 Tax=Novosphingobium flavum TaxID=1778672 RepID=A0A7X1FP06_9SPHN|nr:CHASE domain-containing protein [Novosphingobium flavum]
MPVGIFLLVSAITGLSVYAIEQVETQRAEALNRQIALSASSAMERLASANTVYLRAGAVLMSMQPRMNSTGFHEFAAQLDRDASLRGGGAVAWMQAVEPGAAAAMEDKARADGLAGFTIHPAPQGRVALPVIFVHPVDAVQPGVYGYDPMSDPVRRDAIERAVRSGRPSASGPVQLQSASASGPRTGFGIFVPVFDGSGAERRLVGVLARAFNAQGFIEAALGDDRARGYGIALIDEASSRLVPLAQMGRQVGEGHRIVTRVMFADRPMRIEISPPEGSTLSNLSLLTLLFGMMAAALLLVVARLVTQQAAEDRAALAWFEEQASIRNSLTRELNHRVKNTLANVLSIVTLTRRRTDDIDDFVTGLIGRVRALSATHDLLTQSEWGTTPIRAVVGAELAPYAHDADHVLDMRGPNVELAPNDALSLGLAIHELATNASKYGALSVAGGRVEICWEMITDKLARIEWTESGGPVVPELRRRGFGTELIEKIVAHELKNPVDLRFLPEGVSCSLVVPVRTPAPFQLRGGQGGEG